MEHLITTVAALEARYGSPRGASLLKETAQLTPSYRALIEASPFAVLATAAPGGGLDCSPRGDAPGFVAVADERTLLMPDRPGNRRLDSLRNILADPRVALLFLVPGAGETLRVNGRAEISTDPGLLARFVVDGKLPLSVVRIHVETVYFQCAKAIIRSRLWDPEARAPRGSVPSAGRMLEDATAEAGSAERYDAELAPRLRDTLY